MNSHTTTSKFIHWTFTVLYAYGIFKQVGDLEELEDTSLLNFEIAFAIAFLVIVLIRYFYMKGTPTLLGAREEMRKGHLFIAKTVHRLVYFSLIMLPTTGLLIAAMLSFDIRSELTFPVSFQTGTIAFQIPSPFKREYKEAPI